MKSPRSKQSNAPKPAVLPSTPTQQTVPFNGAAIAVFLVALIIRLLHVGRLRRTPYFDVLLGDAHGYDAWAQRIAGGEWVGHDVFYQAPLYPYFLAVIYRVAGHSLLAVRLVQALLGSAACVLLALAGRRFFSATVGLIAGMGLAIYAPAIFFDSLLQKSVLDVFLLALGLAIIGRLLDARGNGWLWLALGLAMGALSLTRENALVFIVVIVAWCVWGPVDNTTWRDGRPLTTGLRVRLASMFVAGLALVLVPVAVRNAAVGGGFYLTTSQFGPNFYIGNNPRADGTYMSLRFGRGAPEYERQDATELAQHALGRALTPAEVSSYWTDRALTFITSEPGAWLRLMGRKFALLWNAHEMLDTESQESYAEWSWPIRVLGWFGHFGVLVPLALLGAILAWPDRSRLSILYAMTGLYAASVLVFYVFARYRLPLVPLLLLFAAFAAAAAPSRLAALMRGPRTWNLGTVAALVAIVLTVVLANWPLLSSRLMIAISTTNLASALAAEGRSAEAQTQLLHAAEVQDYAPAYNNLGVILKARGSLDQAMAAYRRALSIQPDYPDAHYNLANALLAANKPTEAEEHFAIALRSIPDSAGVRNNLGVALSAQGNTAGAVAAFQAAVAADPQSAKAHRNLGAALSEAGRADDAIASFRRAAALDPADAGIQYDLGSTLLEADRLDEAIAAFQAALRLSPRLVAAHNNLGIAYGKKGNLAGALAEFERALAIDPTFTDAQTNLQMTRTALGQTRR